MDISTQGMKYVCELARTLHFRRAAEACNTSQPNLSTQIKKIEKEIGIILFERSNKVVKLTAEGKQVVAAFQEILSQLAMLKKLPGGTDGIELKMGLFPTLAPYLLPSLIPRLKKRLPALKLTIHEDKTERIVRELTDGALDCILAAYPIDHPKLIADIVFEDPFFVAVSVDHPKAAKPFVTLNDLKTETVLLLEEGHCLRDQSLDICHMDRIPVDTQYEASSLETLRAMVAANAGITLIPQICLDANPLIRYIPFQSPGFSRKIALFRRKTFPNEALMATLIQTLVMT